MGWGDIGGWGALVSLVYMLKKALLQHICSSGIGPTSYPGHFAYKWEKELDIYIIPPKTMALISVSRYIIIMDLHYAII